MIFDAVSFRELLSGPDAKDKALAAFADYIERKLGVKLVRDLREVPFGRADLSEPLRMAELLKQHGIITAFDASIYAPDVPRMKVWHAICNDPSNHWTGGASWESDSDALYAALGEALERYIWFTQNDYFVRPKRATEKEIARYGSFIPLAKIAGFSDEDRAGSPNRELRPDAKYLWIQGVSLIHGKPVYLPAQIVSGLARDKLEKEPIIRQANTNGLATWPTQTGARLGGVLEVVEREAYMTMWLNQMTLPRISIRSLSGHSASFAKVAERSERYRFKTHVIPLPTDAPTCPVAVLMEDMSGNAPRFTIGLKAHQSLPVAAEKAMLEAMRAHKRYRTWASAGNTWDADTPAEKVGHLDRLYYWGVPEHAKHLEFMIAGKELSYEEKEWEKDSIEEHYRRLIAWCKGLNLECISFALGKSAKNPTSFHIEMVIIPECQPTYLNESFKELGGTRWRDIPKKLGHTPREKAFAARPHPFS